MRGNTVCWKLSHVSKLHPAPTFRVEDRDKNFVRNISDFLPDYMMSHLGRQYSSDITFFNTYVVVTLATASFGDRKGIGQVLWDLGELELR